MGFLSISVPGQAFVKQKGGQSYDSHHVDDGDGPTLDGTPGEGVNTKRL